MPMRIAQNVTRIRRLDSTTQPPLHETRTPILIPAMVSPVREGPIPRRVRKILSDENHF